MRQRSGTLRNEEYAWLDRFQGAVLPSLRVASSWPPALTKTAPTNIVGRFSRTSRLTTLGGGRVWSVFVRHA